jgi:predicted nucleotidyltransferase
MKLCDIIKSMATVSSRRARQTARVLLRLPVALHQALVRAAAARDLSFNEYCVRRLGAPASADDASAARTLVVDRARGACGDRLVGVVVLGSWARGEAAASSDIDVLVVTDARMPVTRDLYRAWDREPLAVEGRRVDAHFVNLPDPGAAPTALWCEAAVDGLVWYDRDGAVGSRLGEVRRAIAAGTVVRAFAHGQPYWKGAA